MPSQEGFQEHPARCNSGKGVSQVGPGFVGDNLLDGSTLHSGQRSARDLGMGPGAKLS